MNLNKFGSDRSCFLTPVCVDMCVFVCLMHAQAYSRLMQNFACVHNSRERIFDRLVTYCLELFEERVAILKRRCIDVV